MNTDSTRAAGPDHQDAEPCYTPDVFRSVASRLLHRLDDLSVRRKLMLSYALGFLLPLALVTLSTWVMLTAQARRADREQAEAVLRLVQNQLYSSLESTTRLSGLLGSDPLVNTTLDDWRIDRVGHLVQYRLQLRTYLDSFVTAYPQVSRLEFYTTNPAVVRGGSILLLDENTRQTAWAQAVASSDRGTISVLHLDEAVLETQRALSVTRRLGGQTTDGPRIEHYLRIDIALAEIRNIIQRSAAAGAVMLVDDADNVVVGNVAAANDFQTMTTLAEALPQEGDRVHVSLPLATNGPFANLRLEGYFPYTSTRSLSSYLTLSAVSIGLIGILIASLIQLGIGYSLFRRLQLLTGTVLAARKNHFPVVTENPGNDELGTLITAYNEMTATIDRLMQEVYEEGLTVNRLAVEKRHAELEALISKIDPHFLSNSLNTIRMKSLSRKETETADALKALGRLFDSMTSWQDETIPVRQEVEFISGYLALQRYRFVQPIVENASRHGIEQKKSRGKITVTFQKLGSRLAITVRDNGRGMDVETLARQKARLGHRSTNGESIGLQNVYNRLLLHFAEDAEFDLESEEGCGTTVRVAFSYTRLQSDATE